MISPFLSVSGGFFQGSSVDGKFTISTVKVMAEGKLMMTEDIQYLLSLTTLYVAPSGLIKGGDLVIKTTTATVEEGGVIDLNEGGEFAFGDGMSSKYLRER